MLSAISFGVFCRSAPSTSVIMRSMKVEPCAAVMRTRIQSLTAPGCRRSPPSGRRRLSRITGADSPVIAASLTEATPSIDFAVGGDDVAGLHQHDVADLEAGAGNEAIGLVRAGQQLGLALGAGLLRRLRLGLAAALRDGLGEVGEQHREPQPQDDLEGEAEALAAVARSRRKMTVVSAATTSTTNITGFLIMSRGSSLRIAEPIAGITIFGSSIAETGIRLFIFWTTSMDVTPK